MANCVGKCPCGWEHLSIEVPQVNELKHQSFQSFIPLRSDTENSLGFIYRGISCDYNVAFGTRGYLFYSFVSSLLVLRPSYSKITEPFGRASSSNGYGYTNDVVWNVENIEKAGFFV